MTVKAKQAQPNHEQFTRPLRRVLACLYDPTVLRNSRLIELFGLEEARDPVSALRRTLTEAIESLRPNESTPEGSKAWRIYQILRRRYTEQVTQRQVASDLSLSIRQLQREEKLARDVLADHLWTTHDLEDKAHYLTPFSSQTSGQPSSAKERPLTRAQELEWLSASVPAQRTDVGQVIQEVLATIAPLLKSSGVSVEYTPSAPHAPLLLQAPMLRQALLNVVSGAIQCVPGGQVCIQTQSLPQVGQAFVSAATPATQICITICAIAHREAFPPQRQECTESLKMAEALIHLARGTWEIIPGASENEVFSVKVAFATTEQVTVLVIDDNADALQLFQRYLSGSRYRFVGAQDARRGLALAEELSPHIIVLDVMMPEQDGWTLLGQLREHPRTRGTPVIVCTILSQQDLALALGAADFIRKPVSRKNLLAALDRQLAHLGRLESPPHPPRETRS